MDFTDANATAAAAAAAAPTHKHKDHTTKTAIMCGGAVVALIIIVLYPIILHLAISSVAGVLFGVIGLLAYSNFDKSQVGEGVQRKWLAAGSIVLLLPCLGAGFGAGLLCLAVIGPDGACGVAMLASGGTLVAKSFMDFKKPTKKLE